MSAAIFYELLFCAVNLAILLYAIVSNDNFGLTYFISLGGITNVLLPATIYCYLSEGITSNLASIGDYFYNINWYQLPPKHRQLLISPIRQSQIEFRLKGLGIVECSLKILSSVKIILKTFRIYLKHMKF